MATLNDLGVIVAKQLHERVGRLVAAVEDEASDFEEIGHRAEAVSELADLIAEAYNDLDDTLMRGLDRPSASERESNDAQQAQDDAASGKQRRQESAIGEDLTKEQLLERAREVNVQGRSSMSKEELAEAVDAEESVTKEELLERAREAGVEGRSSMTKDELREALSEAGS